jgi:hypothetical protein
MFRNRIVDLIFLMLVLLSITIITACGTSGGAGVKWGGEKDVVYDAPPVAKKGPPPWAPAHGHRKKYRYRYYPEYSVYYDTGRSLYFYIEADNWVIAASLPNRLLTGLGGYVIVDMNTDKPYTDHAEHKRKYPPGLGKKNKQKKWAHR